MKELFLFLIFISLLNSKIITVSKNMVIIPTFIILQSSMLDESDSSHHKIIVSDRRLHSYLRLIPQYEFKLGKISKQTEKHKTIPEVNTNRRSCFVCNISIVKIITQA